MTLVMAWLNKTNDATALHIASDSCFSYGSDRWDYGPKIFRLFPTYDHLAFCGGIWLGLSVILQGTAVLANTDILVGDDPKKPITMKARSQALCTLFNEAVKAFPSAWANETTLLHCGFDRLTKSFRLFELSLTSKGIEPKAIKLAKEEVVCFGSGKTSARKARG